MINTLQYSLEEGEAGILLTFDIDPAQLKQRDSYIISFDSPVSLPYDPPISLIFTPDPPSYVVVGSSNLSAKIFVKIKSLHRAETKTLLRLTIKDNLNSVLYTDYMLVVCSPQSTVKLDGALLSSANNANIGDNGGSLIRLNQPNTNRLEAGMTVSGNGLPPETTYTIRTIVDPQTIELNDRVGTFDNRNINALFTFTRVTGCVDPSSLALRSTQPLYTVLDFTNNWTYQIGSRIIAKFIVTDKHNNLDTVVLLPIKNAALLNNTDMPAPIPSVSVLKGSGRVMGDIQCLSELVFS